MGTSHELVATIDVSDWPFHSIETIGGEEKAWLLQPSNEPSTRWLFKPNNVHPAVGSKAAWSQREDFAEKVSCELGTRMEIPCAKIELAQRRGRAGCISRDLAPKDWEIQTGFVLLDALLSDYIPGRELSNKLRTGHSLENIRAALTDYAPPAEVDESFDAFDVFVGYIAFDAVVANRDRHDENWAVMRPPHSGPAPVLAGSFDHGRAIGSTLQEIKMAKVL